MKLYEYSKRINRELKDKQWDWIDEEIRRIWDALYNRRGQYRDQFGGGSPFESEYGLTGAAGHKYQEILARIPRGNHIDVNNSPFVIPYPSWQFSVNLPPTYPAVGGYTSGVVPPNYYGRTQGFDIPSLTGGVNGVIIDLLGPNMGSAYAGTKIFNLPGGGFADNSRLDILLDEGEYIQVSVTKSAAGGNVINPVGHFSCLFFARWPLGETSPGVQAVNQVLGTLGPGINNIKFVRIQNLPTLANTFFTIYTCPAGKVAWIDRNFIGLKHDQMQPAFLAGPVLAVKLAGNTNITTIAASSNAYGSPRAMDNFWQDSILANNATAYRQIPILEAGDTLQIRYGNAGNVNVFFHVYERDIETLTTATHPFLGEFATGGVDPF